MSMNEYAMAQSAMIPSKSLILWRTDKHTKVYS